jgi:hypothetical protein
MGSCIVCKSSGKLHVFPKEEFRLQRWMRILNLRSRPSSSASICQQHFLPSDIVETVNGYHKIKHGTVPTQNLKVNSDHTYSAEHKDPCSQFLSLLIMLSPILICWLPLLLVFCCSLSDYHHQPNTGQILLIVAVLLPTSYFLLLIQIWHEIAFIGFCFKKQV